MNDWPTEVELFIQPDGSLLLPRGTMSENNLLCSLLSGQVDLDTLKLFFAQTEAGEIIFGNSPLCG